MKKMLSLALVAILLVASLGFTPAVYADDSSAEADVNMKGIGKLTAHGDGIAALAGGGIVELRGNGILWVKDIAGNANIKVKGFGVKKEFTDGWVQYSGLRGTADIKGSNLRIVIAGVGVDLRAKGHGKAFLWGHGTYEVNGVSGLWETTDFGKPVTIAPSE